MPSFAVDSFTMEKTDAADGTTKQQSGRFRSAFSSGRQTSFFGCLSNEVLYVNSVEDSEPWRGSRVIFNLGGGPLNQLKNG